MANEEHLALLRQGIEVWNKWRKTNRQIKPDLSDANLIGADLSGTNLSGTNLRGANLRDANLRGANLSRTQALETNFEEATFTGACIKDWNINSQTNLNNVICDYVYLKEGEQERRPSNPNKNFAPGEFTELFQKALETVDLIFSDGIDWQAFLASFEKLQVECGSDELAIQAIEKKSGGAFVIRVEVPSEANKAEIEKYIKQEYETRLKVIEEKYQKQLQAKDEELKAKDEEIIEAYRKKSTDLLEMARIMANVQKPPIHIEATGNKSVSETYKSKYDLSQAQVGGIVDTAQTGSNPEFHQHNYAPEQKQTLAEAAAEIQKLLKQLEQSNPSATVEQQQAFVDAAVDPTLKAKFVSALQTGWKEAIKEFLDNSYVNVGVAIFEGWKEAK